jgi:hypothetical protein
VNKKVTRTVCLLFAILCLTQVLAYGQEDDQSGKADILTSRLQLLNGSHSIKVNFSVKNGDGDWVDFSIEPGKERIFTNTTHIRIVTKGNANTVEYKLEYQRRYEIYWNAERERWDVARLVQRR